MISIHALREEGDLEGAVHGIKTKDFYPRPPRGGRLLSWTFRGVKVQFLSTPSARRATLRSFAQAASAVDFYPRPPRGGRLWMREASLQKGGFLSTPSARRATGLGLPVDKPRRISIHALREEGDS